MDRIAAVFEEAKLAPVRRRLSNRAVKHYLFRQYNSKASIPIEIQICRALEQQKLISVSYRGREHQVWTDICRILFCQAFGFDHWTITKPSAVNKCWKKLQTHGVQEFFKEQWRFLEERNTTDVASRRRGNLLFKLYFNYQISLSAKQHARKDDQEYKSYSHYNELLSPENLIIKESVLKLSPSDLQRMTSDPTLNSMLDRIVQEITFNSNGSMNELIDKINAGDFMGGFSPDFSDDGRSLVQRFYFGKDKKLYIKVRRATLNETTSLDLQCLIGFSEPFTYYLSLLQCIDESSVINLMEDLLSDFVHPPDYQGENIKNTDLDLWRWGMPDIVAYDTENNFYILLECKGPNDHLSKRQIRWLSRNLEKYNLNVGLVVASEKQIGHL